MSSATEALSKLFDNIVKTVLPKLREDMANLPDEVREYVGGMAVVLSADANIDNEVSRVRVTFEIVDPDAEDEDEGEDAENDEDCYN